MALQTVELKPSVPTSPLLGFWQVFRRNRMGILGLVMLIVIITLAVFASQLAPYDPKSFEGIQSGHIYNPPSAQHWFGTDDAGKDVLSSFMYGARVSLIVGFFAAFISIVIGGLIGIVAGFYGGRTETFLMGFTDTMLGYPRPAIDRRDRCANKTQPVEHHLRDRFAWLDNNRKDRPFTDFGSEVTQIRFARTRHWCRELAYRYQSYFATGNASLGCQCDPCYLVGNLE